MKFLYQKRLILAKLRHNGSLVANFLPVIRNDVTVNDTYDIVVTMRVIPAPDTGIAR